MPSRHFDTRVKELTQYVQDRQEEKERYRKAEEDRTERQRLIDSVPDVTPTEFYCECHGDFIAMGGKVQFTDSYGQACAYYVSHGTAIGVKDSDKAGQKWSACSCKRYITDKSQDPYYRDSVMVGRLQSQLRIDMLQPNDPEFKKYWGDPYKKFNEQQEAKEKAQWEADRQ